MVRQDESTSPTSTEVKKIVSDEVRPLLDKLTDLVDKLERYQGMILNFNKN